MKDINYDNIVSNLQYLKGRYNKDILFVVKNNAYNTGLEQTVKYCLKEGFNYFALTTIEEALIVRKISDDAYVLVMNPTTKEEIALAKENNLVLSITSRDWYDKFENDLKDVSLHLKVNVGMNRFGLDNIDEINELISKNNNIEGIFTHFPVVEEEDLTLHNEEVDRFVEVFNSIENKNNLKYIHSENSGALLLDDPRLEFCTHARVGIVGYGYSPTEFVKELKSSVYLKSNIIQIRKVDEGNLVGYGFSNKMEKDALVAICPIGYGDGLSKLRSLLPVIINKKEYRVIAISMSHLLIEVDEEVKLNDEVEIYGDTIKIDHLLEVCSTSCSIHMASLK